MKRLLLALLCISPLHTMELIESSNVSSANEALKLYTNHKDMFVEDENAAYHVEKHNMNKELRDILAHKALNKFKEAGYIHVNKDNTGKYTLAAHVRGLGGTGPITAWCVGTIVKAGLWAGVMIGTSLVYKASEKATHGDRTMAAGTTYVGVNAAVYGAGGWAGMATTIEATGNAAAAATLALPWPLP